MAEDLFNNISLYGAILLMVIIAFLIVKKVTGCIVRLILVILLVAAFTALYFGVFK